MHVVPRLGKERRYVTGRTLPRTVEDCLSSFKCSLVIRSGRRLRRRNRELVVVKRGQFGCRFVRRSARISRAALSGDGILVLVVEPSIEERRRAVHLRPGHV